MKSSDTYFKRDLHSAFNISLNVRNIEREFTSGKISVLFFLILK